MAACVRESTFNDELNAMAGGENLRLCMQCGNCTGSCPAAEQMEYSPAMIIAMIRAGLRDEVLASNTQWRCLACYTCTVRCPRGVRITELMHALGRLAAKEKKANAGTLTPVLYRCFNEIIYRTGRIPEISLMLRFYFRTNPFNGLKALPVAWGLLSHGRLGLKGPKFSPTAKKQLQLILDKATFLGDC